MALFLDVKNHCPSDIYRFFEIKKTVCVRYGESYSEPSKIVRQMAANTDSADKYKYNSCLKLLKRKLNFLSLLNRLITADET